MPNRRPANAVRRRRSMRRRAARVSIRSRGEQVLAPAVGAITKRAFGTAAVAHHLGCWDAKLPYHLPLPRAVGPYTVLRVTKRFSSTSELLMFAPFRVPNHAAGGGGDWSNVIAISLVNRALAINAANNVNLHTFSNTLDDSCSVVPSALTLQVMNPNALQSTTGVMYHGISSSQLRYGGTATTGTAISDAFVQFMSPRLLSGPKLCLRGVQTNSYPLNMSALADFGPILPFADSTVTYTADHPEPCGFAPIVMFNPDGTDLEYLVTMELRVRFDIRSVAAATHSHHPVASDYTWDSLMKQAAAKGNGVCDIIEAVANIGQIAGKAYSLIKPMV